MLWKRLQLITAVLRDWLILSSVLTEKLLPTVTKLLRIIGCEKKAMLTDFIHVKFSVIK